jgi:HTH-type transcriptional regulator / antitoxin HigA
MKATLFIIENDADHAQAKALIEKLMRSKDPVDPARMTAQARLIEAFERARWPSRAPSLPDPRSPNLRRSPRRSSVVVCKH